MELTSLPFRAVGTRTNQTKPTSRLGLSRKFSFSLMPSICFRLYLWSSATTTILFGEGHKYSPTERALSKSGRSSWTTFFIEIRTQLDWPWFLALHSCCWDALFYRPPCHNVNEQQFVDQLSRPSDSSCTTWSGFMLLSWLITFSFCSWFLDTHVKKVESIHRSKFCCTWIQHVVFGTDRQVWNLKRN